MLRISIKAGVCLLSSLLIETICIYYKKELRSSWRSIVSFITDSYLTEITRLKQKASTLFAPIIADLCTGLVRIFTSIIKFVMYFHVINDSIKVSAVFVKFGYSITNLKNIPNLVKTSKLSVNAYQYMKFL